MSRDTSITASVGERELPLSNLDKVLYPATGFTKGQVIEYYLRVSEVMLLHVRDRPLTMKRYPHGVEGPFFFEKHAPAHAPDWIRRISVPSASEEGAVSYSVVCDLPTLIWAANLAALEFHVPLWHVGRHRKLPAPPDHMVFDLDPGEGTTIVECCEVAMLIADHLPETQAIYPKSSGSKGLQLYRPVEGKADWERQRSQAHQMAQDLGRAHPDLIVSNMRKSLRKGKILIDWSQNHPSKTTVAAYSLRACSEPTVSTPVTWDEVVGCAEAGDPDMLRFTTDDVLGRIAEQGDLFLPDTR